MKLAAIKFNVWTAERYSALEHGAFRAGYAWLVWYYVTSVRVYKGQPTPNGLGKYVDLTFMADPSIAPVLQGVLAIALLVYVTGRFPVLALGYIGLFHVALDTLKNSQGAIGHSGQLMCVAGLAQWFAYASHPWLRRFGLGSDERVTDVAIHYAKQIIAACYAVAGITKLITSGGRWAIDSPNLAVSLAKANEQEYYNSLTPGLVEESTAITEWILGHPWLSRIGFGSALLLELGCFVALGSRRLAFLVGISLMAMHEGIRQTMSLNFRFNVLVVVVFFVQLPCIAVWLYERQLAPRLPPAWRTQLERWAVIVAGAR